MFIKKIDTIHNGLNKEHYIIFTKYLVKKHPKIYKNLQKNINFHKNRMPKIFTNKSLIKIYRRNMHVRNCQLVNNVKIFLYTRSIEVQKDLLHIENVINVTKLFQTKPDTTFSIQMKTICQSLE